MGWNGKAGGEGEEGFDGCLVYTLLDNIHLLDISFTVGIGGLDNKIKGWFFKSSTEIRFSRVIFSSFVLLAGLIFVTSRLS